MEFISDPSQMELPSAMDFNIHPLLSSAISNTFSSSGFSLLLRWTSSYTFSSSGFSLLLRSLISPLQLHRRSAMESISDPSQICDGVHLRSIADGAPSAMETIADERSICDGGSAMETIASAMVSIAKRSSSALVHHRDSSHSMSKRSSLE
ncbi:hypothetical protein ACOSP7_026633 [Xanthoceras sorbifolium]